MPEHKKKSGTRKFGRNKAKCAAYLSEGRHVKSHLKKLRKHVALNSEDAQAVAALKRMESLVRNERLRTR